MRNGELAGMTVNERLFARGLLDRWDNAVRARDRDAMIRIMREVEVDQPESTVDAVLAQPAKYGF